MRQIQITLRNEPKERIQEIIEMIHTDLNIKNMILIQGKYNSLIIMRQKRTYVPKLIEKLNEIGVGIDFGIIDILPLEATIPELEVPEKGEEEEYSIAKRITVEEIRSNIEEDSKPNFNYFIFVIFSAIVAGAGLILNSPAIVIASMILSPLMGPILGFSFGLMTRDNKMIKDGIIAQIFGILICIGLGIILGIISIIAIPNVQITSEMAARAFPNYLDIIIAICAGMALGFCFTGTVKKSLVGAAIALSLAPPAVNTGLALMYGDLILSLGSLTLLVVNILIINTCTMIILKLKNVRELPKKAPLWEGPREKIKKKRKWRIKFKRKKSTESS